MSAEAQLCCPKSVHDGFNKSRQILCGEASKAQAMRFCETYKIFSRPLVAFLSGDGIAAVLTMLLESA